MAQMSRRFNFDDFDAQIAEALDEHRSEDARLVQEDEAWEEEQKWGDYDRVFYPGEIGGVACKPTLTDGDNASSDNSSL